MEDLYASPFCPEIDKIKSQIDNGDICILLLVMTGLCVLVNVMCHTMLT